MDTLADLCPRWEQMSEVKFCSRCGSRINTDERIVVAILVYYYWTFSAQFLQSPWQTLSKTILSPHPAPPRPSTLFLLAVSRQFLFCSSSLFVCWRFHTWRLFLHYLFLISYSFGALDNLCFVIVAFPRCLHFMIALHLNGKLYNTNNNTDNHKNKNKTSLS